MPKDNEDIVNELRSLLGDAERVLEMIRSCGLRDALYVVVGYDMYGRCVNHPFYKYISNLQTGVNLVKRTIEKLERGEESESLNPIEVRGRLEEGLEKVYEICKSITGLSIAEAEYKYKRELVKVVKGLEEENLEGDALVKKIGDLVYPLDELVDYEELLRKGVELSKQGEYVKAIENVLEVYKKLRDLGQDPLPRMVRECKPYGVEDTPSFYRELGNNWFC